MSAVVQYEFLVLLLILIVVLELVARRFRFPPAAAFILGGGAVALIPGVPTLTINPELVMVIFLPPLLMNGAYFTVWREFRSNFSGIISLAIGAVAFTTLAVGVAAKALVPELPWAVCFALGAIVSPPDAVAAGAILEKLQLPARLNALLQGESLLNDAAGLVLFRIAIASALTGAFSATQAVGSLFLLSIGGAAVGLAVGQLGLMVMRRLRESDLIITASLLLPAIAYIGGERLHVSGVIATVTTGLLLGWRQHHDFSAATRIRSQAFWRVMVFLLESIVFILIGLSLRGVLERMGPLQDVGHTLLLPVLGVTCVVIASRFVWLYGSDIVLRVVRRLGWAQQREPSFRIATIMGWAGMRGVVTLVVALSVPETLPGRDFLLVCAFAVILVTVLLQGTTLGPLIKYMKVTGARERKLHQESEDYAWMRMTEAQCQAISAVSRQADGTERHPRLLDQFRHRALVAAQAVHDRDNHKPIKNEHYTAMIAAIGAGRAEALRMHASGEIHDRVLRDLEHELDLQQLVAESHLN
jgi:CPA1 family monovalent cation:H+ antiporter